MRREMLLKSQRNWSVCSLRARYWVFFPVWCVCVCICVCMVFCVCTCTCIYVCVSICMDVCVCVSMCICRGHWKLLEGSRSWAQVTDHRSRVRAFGLCSSKVWFSPLCYNASRQGGASNKLLGDQRGFLPETLLLDNERRAVSLSPCWQRACWLQRSRLDAQSRGASGHDFWVDPFWQPSLELELQEWHKCSSLLWKQVYD